MISSACSAFCRTDVARHPLAENRERPLIQCRINARDKRKIDVELTGTGEKALLDYQGKRVGWIVDQLSNLPDDDQEDLLRSLHKLHGLLDTK